MTKQEQEQELCRAIVALKNGITEMIGLDKLRELLELCGIDKFLSFSDFDDKTKEEKDFILETIKNDVGLSHQELCDKASKAMRFNEPVSYDDAPNYLKAACEASAFAARLYQLLILGEDEK